MPITDKHRYKNQNISKLNSTVHYDDKTPQSSGIYFRDIRVVQLSQN